MFMKILQINKFFYLKGGAERYFFDLAEVLSRNGHQVLVFSSQNQENFDYPGQENFAEYLDFNQRQGWLSDFRKAIKVFWNREAAKKLEKIIIEQKPEIAHLHNFFGHLSPSIVYLLKKYQIPVVVTLHDYKWICPNYLLFNRNQDGQLCYDCLKNGHYRKCLAKKCVKDSYLKSLIGYLEGKWQKDILKLADQIDVFIAPSRFIKNKLQESGIESGKIKQIPNFLDSAWIDFKDKDKIKPIQPYLFYCGRLSREKGINLLISAFAELAEKYPEWQLKIAGIGPEGIEVARAAEENKQIQLLGQLGGNQLKSFIQNAYAVVIPSLWPENFPYAALESFALAKPVIAAKTGGLPELLNREANGILFKRGDRQDLKEKLIWAIKHPQAIKQKGKAARQDVLTKYQPSAHYERLLKTYQQALSINSLAYNFLEEAASNQ